MVCKGGSRMIPAITQENVRIFIPYKVSKIFNEICLQKHLTATEAVLKFYKTKLSRLLSEENTKRWHLGWVALYDMYKEEVYGN